MPGRDGTGPLGQGPMTGRGMGLCNPYYAGSVDPRFYGGFGLRRGFGLGYGWGFGRGFGRGLGRGFGRAFYPHDVYEYEYGVTDQLSEKELLEKRRSVLEAELEEIKKILASYQDADKE